MCFFCYSGTLGKGEMRGGRSICVMIYERASEDFITFYMYSCLYRLDSVETRMSQLPHSSQSREIGVVFCCNCVWGSSSRSRMRDAAGSF